MKVFFPVLSQVLSAYACYVGFFDQMAFSVEDSGLIRQDAWCLLTEVFLF